MSGASPEGEAVTMAGDGILASDEGLVGRGDVGSSGDTVASVARFSLMIFVAATVLNLFERLVRSVKVPDIRRQVASLQQEVASLRAQALKLVSPDTFAQAAKADRKAIALEKEVERLQRLNAMNARHWMVRMPGVLRSVLFMGLLFVVVMSPKGELLTRRVVMILEPGWVWPLGRWMSVLSGHAAGTGVIGAVPWAVLSHRVSKYVLGMA